MTEQSEVQVDALVRRLEKEGFEYNAFYNWYERPHKFREDLKMVVNAEDVWKGKIVYNCKPNA